VDWVDWEVGGSDGGNTFFDLMTDLIVDVLA
jgi:hypothetical protein